MIIDSSALLAILLGEEDRQAHLDALAAAPQRRMSAATYVEIGIVVDSRRDAVLGRGLDELLREFSVTIEAVSPEQADAARAAHRDFGRGTGHPAKLNFGDCFSYALAATRGEPLLFTGDDFTHTDVRRVHAP